MQACNEDVQMTVESGEGSKSSSGLAPKRAWQADTMTSWTGRNGEAEAGGDMPDTMKESYYKEDVTILK